MIDPLRKNSRIERETATLLERERTVARHEADREDLWAEAVAMTERVEISVPDQPEPVIIGYRDNGWCSVYFGQDVMLQFTSLGELRRAFCNGDLFRTQGTTLARLSRQRVPEEITLLRHDLTPDELAEFRQEVHARLQQLLEAILSGQVTIRRETPLSNGTLLDEATNTLQEVLQSPRFLAPAILGKN